MRTEDWLWLAAGGAVLLALSRARGDCDVMDDDCPQPVPPGDDVDPYPTAFEPETSCDPTAKPGVISFRQWVTDFWGERPGSLQNIVRSCNPATSSGHEEGRAWDWMIPSKDAAEDLLRTILEPGEGGAPHAIARKAGLLYVIYNRRIWRAYPHPKGSRVWAPYGKVGGDPHVDHVHFSFTWKGARGETSFYQGQPSPPSA